MNRAISLFFSFRVLIPFSDFVSFPEFLPSDSTELKLELFSSIFRLVEDVGLCGFCGLGGFSGSMFSGLTLRLFVLVEIVKERQRVAYAMVPQPAGVWPDELPT